MNLKSQIIRLASTNHKAVRNDMQKVIPDWNNDYCPRRLHLVNGELKIVALIEAEGESTNKPHIHISGGRIDIFDAKDRIINPAITDDEGNIVQESEYAGEKRIDIIYPISFTMPSFDTQVFPKTPDRLYV